MQFRTNSLETQMRRNRVERIMQSRPIAVRVFDIIGSPYCVSSRDGQHLFDKIQPLIEDGRSIDLSFEGVDIIISAFLNAAVGQLLGHFSAEQIDRQLTWSGLDEDDDRLLHSVIKNAQLYFERRGEADRPHEDDLDTDEDDE